MPSAGFEPLIPADELPQTYALECTATGIGHDSLQSVINSVNPVPKIIGPQKPYGQNSW